MESLYTLLGVARPAEAEARTTFTKKVETNDEDVNDGLDVASWDERTAVTATVETVDNDREMSSALDLGEPGDATDWLTRTEETKAKETLDNDQELLVQPGLGSVL